jgi:hypothetical protein
MKPRYHQASPAPESSVAGGAQDRGHCEHNDFPESNWGQGAASAYTAMEKRDHGRRAMRPPEDERPGSH